MEYNFQQVGRKLCSRFLKMCFNGKTINYEVDTAANRSLISSNTWRLIGSAKIILPLELTTGFGNDNFVPDKVCVKVNISYKTKKNRSYFCCRGSRYRIYTWYWKYPKIALRFKFHYSW